VAARGGALKIGAGGVDALDTPVDGLGRRSPQRPMVSGRAGA
jgi:hypothetical protein